MPQFSARDGCRIHYDIFGDAGPRILLIPGLGGDGRFFKAAVDLLRPDHRVITMDHRGAGRSDRPNTPYSIELIASDANGILVETGGPAHIVGHSTGGAVAQVLALDHPNSGLSFTISSSWAKPDVRFETLFALRATLLDRELFGEYQHLTHLFGYDEHDLETQSAQLALAVSSAAERLTPAPVTAARVRMLLKHNRLEQLKKIQSPTQVVAAQGDILTPPSLTRAIAEAIPGASFKLVAGAHFHPQTKPDAFANLIRSFISGAKNDR
jgi:aminoacrylate hydrolase